MPTRKNSKRKPREWWFCLDKQNRYFEGEQSDTERLKKAFEAGHRAKVRQEYNSAIIRNGFVSAAGRFISCEEAFADYIESDEFLKSEEPKL